MTILKRILENKKLEIRLLKKEASLELLKQQISRLPKRNGGFLRALKKGHGVAVIAEIKKKSPSKGVLRRNFDPAKIAKAYQRGDARALSVLTDRKFFSGSAKIFQSVRRVTALPILRKDFILDEYQVYESRLLGADAILLIAGILSEKALKRLGGLAEKLGMDVLFEAHNQADIKKILPLKPGMIGINNRDLKSFKVDIQTTEKLAKNIPAKILLVSESGIQSREDLIYLGSLGIKAVLVGESLMKSKDIARALRKLQREAA